MHALDMHSHRCQHNTVDKMETINVGYVIEQALS